MIATFRQLVWIAAILLMVVGLIANVMVWLDHSKYLQQVEPCSDDASPDRELAVRLTAVRAQNSREALVKALKDESADVRLLAVQKVRDVAPLIDAFRDPHEGVRAQAAISLYYCGPSAIPALLEALKDDDQRVREGAALALDNPAHEKYFEKEWSEAHLKDLVKKAKNDEDEFVRKAASRLERRFRLER